MHRCTDWWQQFRQLMLIPTSWFRSSSPCRLHAQKSSATAIMCFDPEAQKLSCCFNCERHIKELRTSRLEQSLCERLSISAYIYSVYAIVCYWELLTSTTVTVRCPQSELSLDASRRPKRNRRSGKACQPSRKSLRLRDIARQNTSKIIKIVWHKPDPIHIIHAYYIFHHTSLCVLLFRISQPLDLQNPIGLCLLQLRSIKPWSRSKLGDIRVAPGCFWCRCNVLCRHPLDLVLRLSQIDLSSLAIH